MARAESDAFREMEMKKVERVGMGRSRGSRSSTRHAPAFVVGLAVLLAGAPASAAGEGPSATNSVAGEGAGSADSANADGEIRVEGREMPRRPAGKAPGLDALLQLPSGYRATEPDAVAGAGENEWRRRFVKAERELEEAKQSLATTKQELDKVAGEGGSSQWSIAAPGASADAGPGTSPLSFKLRQQLREDRERIEVLEKALRDLRIEADLAGVPQSWRVAQSDPGAGGARRD